MLTELKHIVDAMHVIENNFGVPHLILANNHLINRWLKNLPSAENTQLMSPANALYGLRLFSIDSLSDLDMETLFHNFNFISVKNMYCFTSAKKFICGTIFNKQDCLVLFD